MADSLNDIAALLDRVAQAGPALPQVPRVARYADYSEAKLFIAQASADGFSVVCCPPSLYQRLGALLPSGQRAHSLNGIRVVEEMHLRDGEIVALPASRPAAATPTHTRLRLTQHEWAELLRNGRVTLASGLVLEVEGG